ncbi:MAG TPA: 4Fe-4S dicluster domain-containing protein [Acidobacteriota bacterium]|nr:4Fe-4S dicluster domain-containing protein [Acidobacteriota bacterium]
MRARIIDRQELITVVDLLRKEYEVVAPFYGRGRDTYFQVVTDENRDQIQLHLPNPYHPPKKYVLPQIQRMMRIRYNGKVQIEPTYEEKKRAIFGIRSCDVAGIYHLDRIFLGGDYRDIYYDRFRKNLFLVNVVCTQPEVDIDQDCFCVCADTGPAARGHFDLQLMDLGDVILVLAGTEKGEALYTHPFFRKATPAHIQKRQEILADVRKKFATATSWYTAAVRYVSFGKVPEEVWEDVGNRCLECGGCSYVCPTCNCFTVTDREISEGEIERTRLWDSCALSGFTRMAGGHNPRKAVHDRRNRRFFRKLSHYNIQRELSVACIGCGRCVNVCHGDVGMPSVVEIIRRSCAEKLER